MKICILGAGNVGGTLGRAWARKGHDVFFGVPRPGDAGTQEILTTIGSKARAGTVAEAAAAGDVIVLATPWPAAREAIQAAGNLAGKLVVDCTNPLKPDFTGLALGYTTSGAEQVAEWATGAPWAAVPEALKAAGDFECKTLFSCVNCLKADFNGLEVGISEAWFPPAILSPT
jgi:predicted dinucleotide-binding enzyme